MTQARTAPPADLATLAAIHKANGAMILRQAALAGAKAVSFGSESLDALVTRIADSYGLDAADRAALYPFRSDRSGGAAAAQVAGTAVKAVPVAVSAAQLARGEARGAGRTFSLAALALGLWGASTAGWFWKRASAYDRSCYDLLRARLEAAARV